MRARSKLPPRAQSSTSLSNVPLRPPPPRLTRTRAIAACAVLAWAALAVAARLAGGAHVQRLMASFEPGTPLVVSPESAAAHASLMVVDLHCDASWVPRCVTWQLRCRRAAVAEAWRAGAVRDLLSRAQPSRCGLWRCERSHVDVPRLVAGNVALQVFTAFTQVPSAPHCDGPIPVCDPLPVGNSNASFDSVSALVPNSGAPRRGERTAAAPAQQSGAVSRIAERR